MKIHYEHISNLCTYNIPKRIGAYVITHTYNNITAEKYVGSTKNLYKRMCGHCNKEIICIDLFITDDIILAESLERILIDLIEPATNIQTLSLSNNDKYVMKELLENVEIKKFISNNMIKVGSRFLKYVKSDKKRTKENKTIIIISDDVHYKIVKKQTELLEKGIKKRIQDIADIAINEGIDKVMLVN